MPTEELRLTFIKASCWMSTSPAYGSQEFIADAEQKDAIDICFGPRASIGEHISGMILIGNIDQYATSQTNNASKDSIISFP